jgi:hypothetical protein
MSKPSVPRQPSAPKPRRSSAHKPHKAHAAPKKASGKPKVSQTKVNSFSTLKWDRVVRDAPWVSRQSMNLNPGSPAAISKYRNSKKFVARTKKVIRPRITKVPKTAGTASGQKTMATGQRGKASWRQGGTSTDRQRRSTPGGKL